VYQYPDARLLHPHHTVQAVGKTIPLQTPPKRGPIVYAGMTLFSEKRDPLENVKTESAPSK
jgi:hypothetical protein